MAVIRRTRPELAETSLDEEASSPRKVSRLEAFKAKKAAEASLVLATELSEPVRDHGKISWLIYGEMKIGKTSLASMFPGAQFMLFEPGGRGLSIRKNEVATWDEFKVYVPQILSKGGGSTVVIDTAPVAYDACFDYVCRQKGVDHPSAGKFGDVWTAIEREFVGTMTKINMSGNGLIFIAHAETKTFQKRTGGEYDKIIPAMSKQAREYMKAVVDVTAYFGYYGNERYLTVAGSDELDAGHRMKYQFWAQDGTRVHSVPMGTSEEEGYENLVRAFNNEQADDGDPGRKATLSERPKARK